MNGQRFIALRATGGGRKVLGAAQAAADHLRDLEEVVADSLSAQDAGEVRGSPEILGLAPVMPVTLTKPVQLETPGEDKAEGATWGVEAVGALKSACSGAGVTVAVLDSGIDAGHEAFTGRTIVQRDFTREGDGDRNGHGTHCAGTVFGGEVGGLRIGVAPGIRKALIGKVLDRNGGGDTGQIIDAIWWAVHEGANIISMSIGFDFPRYAEDLRKGGMESEPAISLALSAYRDNVRLFEKLAELVRARASIFSNVVIVAAAGNESRRPQYEIATAPPATADGIISVGALQRLGGDDRQFGVAPFSNAGPMLAGPGVSVRSARAGGGLTAMNGTSMATPHVAGVAALWLEQIWGANPKAAIRQLEGRLLGKASLDTVSEGHRRNAGLGLVQAPF